MAPQQQRDLSTAIAERQQQGAVQQQQGGAAGPATFEGLLRQMTPEFGKVLVPALPPETFVRLALNEVRANPRLLECTTQSMLGALMTAARLNLEPGGPIGQFYLTPRYMKVPGTDRKAWQVVPIIGYRGLRDLALRTRRVTSIQSFIVRDGDEFRYGSNETRGFWHEWVPADTDEDDSDRPWKGVLTIAQLPGGEKPVWRYLSKSAVLARRDRGAAGSNGPWATDEEAMVRKTGIRAIAPDLPSSSIMAEAVRADETVQVYTAGRVEPQAQEQQQIEAPRDQEQQQPETPRADEPPAEEPQQPAQRGRSRGRQQATPPPQEEQPQQGAPVAQGLPAPPPPDIDVQDPPEGYDR